MSPKEFFDKVCRMRKAQKEYIRTKSGRWQMDSKRFEKEIDAEIERVGNKYVIVWTFDEAVEEVKNYLQI